MGGKWVSSGIVLLSAVVLSVVLTSVHSEKDFPPPPMPKRPPGWKIYCDICQKMMDRVVPFCQREEQNMDYLTDFCTYNYNSLLRPECDYITNVMDFVWCPNACSQVRKNLYFTHEKVCHHRLVNCTERVPYATRTASPSPSPSAPLSPDCSLCEYTIKNVAEMCMNEETANKKNVYQVCMTKTTNTRDFDSCTEFLQELVALAGTRDPCEMLSCDEPKVACKQILQEDGDFGCHVTEYNKDENDSAGVMGLDADGNIIKPVLEAPVPPHKTMTGLGPSDFNPGGPAPYHEPSHPHNSFGDRMSVLYKDTQHESYSMQHLDEKLMEARAKDAESSLANVSMT